MVVKKKPTPYFLGIDPGKSGFMCLTQNEVPIECIPLPWIGNELDYAALDRQLKEWRDMGLYQAVIEIQNVMPRDGAVGAFRVGIGFGAIKQAIQSVGIRCHYMLPKKWKEEMGVLVQKDKALEVEQKPNESTAAFKSRKKATVQRINAQHKKDLKDKAKRKAQELAPTYDFRATPRARVLSDNKAEAFLLSVLAYRKWRGTLPEKG